MASPKADTQANAPRPPAASRRPRRYSREEDIEPLPILGGRLMIAAIAAFCMLAIFPLRKVIKTPMPAENHPGEWNPGEHSRVRITVVTADYEQLMCASEQNFGGAHCERSTKTAYFPKPPNSPIDDNRRNVLQPYRTYPDNLLILVSGLWAQPAIATRLHAEPPQGIAEQKLARFVADCDLEFLARTDNVQLRWKPNQNWNTEERNVPVARAVNCTLGTTD